MYVDGELQEVKDAKWERIVSRIDKFFHVEELLQEYLGAGIDVELPSFGEEYPYMVQCYYMDMRGTQCFFIYKAVPKTPNAKEALEYLMESLRGQQS